MKATRYRIREQHPRRGGPLVIRNASNDILGVSGDTCDHLSPDELASLIRNDYVEPIEPIEADAPKRRKREAD